MLEIGRQSAESGHGDPNDKTAGSMDFDLPPEDHPTRRLVRTWIAEHPDPTPTQLVEAGLCRARTGRGRGGSTPTRSTNWSSTTNSPGPASGARAIRSAPAGPPRRSSSPEHREQHERYLPKIFSGEEIWCQLFSEPDAGSDLANLSTRAVRDGDEYVVNGSKIWSSGAHHASFGILIARTDPDQPKHKGISYFICPMDLPGITMSPIVDMTTAHSFNQVFFDDVRIPASLLVGAGERRLAAGEGHALQRAGVAVVGGFAVGCRPVGRAPAST